jgi:hypothetical protein
MLWRQGTVLFGENGSFPIYTHVESFVFYQAGVCMDVQTPISLLSAFVNMYKHSIIQKKPLYVCTSLRFSPAGVCMFVQSSAKPFLSFGSTFISFPAHFQPLGLCPKLHFLSFLLLGVCPQPAFANLRVWEYVSE